MAMTFRQLGQMIMLMNEEQKDCPLVVETIEEHKNHLYKAVLSIAGPTNQLMKDNTPAIMLNLLSDQEPSLENFTIPQLAKYVGLDEVNASLTYQNLGILILDFDDEQSASSVTMYSDYEDETYAAELMFSDENDENDPTAGVLDHNHPYIAKP